MRADPASRLRTRARSVAAWLCLAALVGATAPATAAVHYLSGNARYQIGNGLPVPVTFAPVPAGAVQALPGATVQQTSTSPGLPHQLVIEPGQLTGTGSTVHGNALSGVMIYQARTALTVQFPASTVTFKDGGRTGPATVTFCPGNVVTVGGNGCLLSPAAPGLLRYTRTGRQFGGPAFAAFQGSASIARGFGASAPCSWIGTPSCTAVFLPGTLGGGFGGPFGYTAVLPNPAPNPGHFQVTASAGGKILALGPSLGPGLSNTRWTFPGPWTTGRVTVSQPAAVPAQLFILSGNDARTAGGQGSISLVSGAIVHSSVTGPEGARGWLNLTVLPEPAPGPGVAACVAALGVLSVWRRRRRGARPAGDGS